MIDIIIIGTAAVIIGLAVVLVGVGMMCAPFFAEFSVRNILLAAGGLLLASVVLGAGIYVIAEADDQERHDCEAIGGEMVRIDKGYAFNAATKTTTKWYATFRVVE